MTAPRFVASWALAVFAAAIAAPAWAAPVVFQGTVADRAGFLASVGASVSYTETFESVPVSKNAGHASFTQAGATYTALGGTNVFVASAGYTNFGAGVGTTTTSILTANGDEHFDVSLASAVDVLAMDVYTNGLGPLTISFYNAATLLGSASWTSSADDIRFLGFKGDQAVTRFEFISTLGGRLNTGLDNIAFASAAGNGVPEPGTLSLAAGALVLAAARRRR